MAMDGLQPDMSSLHLVLPGAQVPTWQVAHLVLAFPAALGLDCQMGCHPFGVQLPWAGFLSGIGSPWLH